MSVSDFFKKKTKEYPSGAKKNTLKGHLFRSRVLAAALVLSGTALPAAGQTYYGKSEDLKKQVLTEAFERHSLSERGDTLLSYKMLGSKTDAERVGGLVNRLMETPTGASVLKELEKHDCVIALMPVLGNNFGLYVPEINSVLLNAQAPDSVLISTLVHEGTHARQVRSTGYNLDFKFDLASLFTLGRAMEADATKNQVLVARELAELGDSSAWNAVKADCVYPVRAFEKALHKTPGDRQAAERAAFLGYYGDRAYLEQYEVLYTSAFIKACRDTPPEKLGELGSMSLSVDSIAAKICVSDGISYLPDASALKDSTRYFIRDYTKKNLDSTVDFLMKRRREHSSGKENPPISRDVSYKSFYILKFTGGFEKPETKPAEKKELPDVRRVAALKAEAER